MRRALELRDGDRSIRVEPGRGLRVTYSVDFAHPAIGRQQLRDLVIDDESFESEICRARTFGFLREVEALWRSGLARGGNLDNTVVMDEFRVLNRDGLRWPDEFVRHKVLDLLVDLALLGLPIEGHVIVERGGHALHQRLVRALLDIVADSEPLAVVTTRELGARAGGDGGVGRGGAGRPEGVDPARGA